MTDLTKDEVSAVAQKAGCAWLYEPLAQRFATLCRAPLVEEVERLEQWHAEMADNRNAIASERDTLKAELARMQAGEPTAEQLTALFTKESGGPNPYYRCRNCGKTEPGLQEYLAAHWKTCVTPQPAAQEPTSAVPVVRQMVVALDLAAPYFTHNNQVTAAIAAGQKFIKENGK